MNLWQANIVLSRYSAKLGIILSRDVQTVRNERYLDSYALLIMHETGSRCPSACSTTIWEWPLHSRLQQRSAPPAFAINALTSTVFCAACLTTSSVRIRLRTLLLDRQRQQRSTLFATQQKSAQFSRTLPTNRENEENCQRTSSYVWHRNEFAAPSTNCLLTI